MGRSKLDSIRGRLHSPKPVAKKDDIIGIRKLRSAFDEHVFLVLGNSLQRMENTAKGKPAQYKVVADLPTYAEYQQLKRKKFTTTAADLMATAWEELQSLSEEMRSWHDNLSESLQQTEVGQSVGEVADELEGYEDPNQMTDILDEIEVVYLPAIDVSSRSKRASEAGSMLQAAAEAIRNFIEQYKEDQEEWPEEESQKEPAQKEAREGAEKNEAKEGLDLSEVNWEDLEQLADEVESLGESAMGLSFPTMYG